MVIAFRAFWKLNIFITVVTPQDNIIEALEAEIVKLKAEIADTASERDEYQKKYDALKLYVRPLR